MDYSLATGTSNYPTTRRVFQVSELNRAVRELLEGHFLLIWLEGEISNLARPASGHLYFSLKDQQAQVRCALFRNRARQLSTPLSNGQHILVRARISLYEPRGEYQLIIEQLEDAGEGALRRAFEALRLRLEQEGLFAAERKRPLPRWPTRVGVITSASGAAVHDVLSVLKRRFPALPVLLYPVQVQGDGAATSVVQALTTAGQRQDCDVLLLVRGGGSLEDLQAFNEEAVARAIVQCPIPVVSGIGHESDVTIADFVADVRAATPSAAAELISPNQAEWLARFSQLEQRLSNVINRSLSQRQRQLGSLQQRLERQHPGRRLQQQAQRLDDLEQRLRRAMAARLRTLKTHQAGLQIRLLSQAPQQRITYIRQRWQGLEQRLQQAMGRLIETKRLALSNQARALHSVSPLQTLQRGYAIVRKPDGTLIRQAEQVQAGDPIEALLGAGKLLCTVDESYRDESQGDKSHHDD